MEGADERVNSSDSLSVMIQTARARGVENSAPEPPTPATTSKGIIGSPINTQTNSLMRRPPKREAKHNVEEKSCHRSVDEVPMAAGGTKHRTNNGTPPPREGFSVRRASASKATAPGTTASSSRAGRLERHASSSNAMAATTTASSTPTRDGSLERRASTSNATAAAATASSRAGFFGSFDDSRYYWDYASRFTSRQDIGNKCRECKRPFLGLNEEIVVRR